MPSLRDIKRRIRSVQSTQQITRAMKMVAASRLRRGQATLERFRAFGDAFGEVVRRAVHYNREGSHPWLETAPDDGPVIIIVASGDRGLCGGYNHNVIALAERELRSLANRRVSLVSIGRMSRRVLMRRGRETTLAYRDVPMEKHMLSAQAMLSEIMELRRAEGAAEVRIVYSRFVSALQQQPEVLNLLPVEVPEVDDSTDEVEPMELVYSYEPGVGAFLGPLLRHYIEVTMCRILMEVQAGEYGARMTAMDNATENASEMIDNLTLMFNRLRQSTITRELIDIVGGAESLRGS